MAMYVWAHIINNYVHFIFTLALHRGVEISHVRRSYIIGIKLIGNLKTLNWNSLQLNFNIKKCNSYITLLYQLAYEFLHGK